MMTQKQNIARKLLLTNAHKDYGKGLNLRAFFKTHDHCTSEDLVQETFTKTWVYLVKGGNIIQMKAFLYHILNNLIVDEYRKNKPISLDALMEKGFEPNTVYKEEESDKYDIKLLIPLIHKLPRKYQKIIEMKYIKDLTLKEISLITGQSKNGIAVQIHRGLKMLKILYKPL